MTETANRRETPGRKARELKPKGQASPAARIFVLFQKGENEKMANKTRLKHAGKRGLSFFLALVMCISLVQITAFAQDETPDEEQARLQIEDDSGKLVYYTYDNGWGDPDSIPKNS